jgi:hypothetical protein
MRLLRLAGAPHNKVSAENAGQIDLFDTIRGSSAIRAVCRGTMIIAASERNYRLCVENAGENTI